ncbi:YSIRK-type signal peptide-containing protein, partial [Streptococcus sp. 4886]|uniref:YSIRK-type signal peptide-containing protein n=1 Tax=Streptococcus sp. 4886 TaxID=2582682 RepID=UPI00156325D2
MRKSYRDDNGEKIFRYSIRKYHFGAASVAVAALMFFANGAVAASETITPATTSDVVTAGSDGNADGNPASSDEEDSKKALTDQPAEIKAPDEVKTKEAPAEEANQGQAAAEPAEVDSNSSQPESAQETPQAEGEKEQEEPAAANTEAAKSTQSNLQALLAKLTLSSMQELHAEVEARLAAAKAVLEDPKATQAQVDEQARLMAELMSRVNQALTPSLETPAILEKASFTSTGLATSDGFVSNQTSSTSLLQPRTLKNNQPDYDPIPLGDDEDDIRDELFSSENPVTTIQPRSPRSVTSRSVPPKTTGSSPYNDKYRYYFEKGQDPENSRLPRYTYAFFNERALIGRGNPDKVSRIKDYLKEEVKSTADGFSWKVTVNQGRQNLDGISFLFSVPNGQSLVPNSVTVTQVDGVGTTAKSSDPRDGNDDYVTASLKATNAKAVTKGTPTNTNARGKGGRFGPNGSYDVSSLDRIWGDTAGQGNDSFHSRGNRNDSNAATGLQNDEERRLGDSKKDIVNQSGGTVYSGKIAGNTSYTITFKTRGNNDLDKLVYFSAVKGSSSSSSKTYLAMLLHARTQGERGFADKTRFRLKGNGYYQVEQNTAYYTSTVLNSTGQEIKKDGANTAYSYSKYKDKPLDNGVKGVLTGNDTNDTDKAFDLDEYSYSEYVNDQDQVLNKDDLSVQLGEQQQTITWYKGDQQISKSDLTKDAISSSGVHTYRYRVSYKDNSFNEGEIHFVTKPKKPIIDTNLSTAAGTTTNIRVSNVDSNTTVELYKKGGEGQNDTLVSSISSGNQGGTVTFNNVAVDYANYYVKQKANGTWYEQNGTKREGVYSDRSSEKDASGIVIERISAIGGQNDTRWKNKPALNNNTDFNLPAGSDVLIGFRAKSPKGLKSLNVTVLGGLKEETKEHYGQQGDTTLGVNLRSPGGNSGGYSIVVAATDSLGNVKEYRMNINFPPNSGSFDKNPAEDYVATPEKLKGKALVPLATEQPPIVIHAKGINVSNARGIDNKHKWKAFLVDGGRNVDDSDSGSKKAVDFKDHIVAETIVKEGGIAEFISARAGDFKREQLKRKPLHLVVAMVNTDTNQIVDKYVSALSDDTLEATYPQFTKSPELDKGTNEITASIGHLQADKAQVRYTDEAGIDKTVGFSKVNSRWEKDNPNQDTTIVVTEDAGNTGTATVHIPYGTAKRGTEIFASQKVDANTEYSEESKIEVPTGPTVQHPNKPEISQSPEDLGVTIKVGQGNADKATVLFSDLRNSFRSFMLSKKGNSWEKDQAQATPEVSVTSSDDGTALVRIPYGVAKIGSQVVANQRREGQTKPSENAFHKVLGRLEGLTNVAQADGSVDITVPDTATKFDLTYRNQRNNTTETLHYSKDTQGRWGNVTGITANGNRFTLPKGLVADGTTVSVIASNNDRTTTTVESKAKFEQPSATTSATRQNGDVEVTLPTDAEDVTLTYKNKQNTSTTVTLTKEGTNWTSKTNLPDGVSLANGKVTFDYTKVNRDTAITTASTRGKNDVQSQANSVNHNIPEHTAPTTQNVVIAAGATPTNEQLATGVTVATKQSVVAKNPQTAIVAGTTKVVATTLTYQDGSSETVNVTVISKPTAPTVNDLESRPNVTPGLLSTARTISGQAMPGAEKVKLTLQNGSIKEIIPEADGSWTYKLGADEFLTQTSSRFNAKYTATPVSLVQVKNNVESEATNVGVVMGRAIIDTPLQAGRKITVHIPHDTTSGYIRIGGTTARGGVDIGLKKDGDTWTLSTDADKANKLELVSEADPDNPSMTKVTLQVKDTDAALYSSPFTIGSDRGNVKFRAHYYNGGNINGPVSVGRVSDLDWILSEEPTNTIPTVSWETGKEVQNGQKIPSPTVDELKDLFKGEDVEDDNGLTVGYAASNRGRLRVRVFTGRDIANNIEGTPVSAQANGRIAPGNYTLVLSTIDAARAESNLLERNVVIQSHADYYRDTVKYPTAEEKVTYNDDAAITNGNFTPTAKTSFKDKIQELNGTVLPASTRYTVGTTDDKAKVAVINFPDGSTIDISHAVVAKPEVPTVTFTHDNKLSDADRTISGTALQNATKVTIQFQDGRGTQGRVDVTPVNGQWSYALPEGRYLRQTEQSSLPGSSTVPVRVTQTVFDATSDAASVYVAKDRNFTGKTITGVRGSAELEQLKSNPKDGISYTERGAEQTFPSDFDATWKTTPDVTSIGTRTYIANIFEKDKVDRVSQEVTVKVVVKPSTP